MKGATVKRTVLALTLLAVAAPARATLFEDLAISPRARGMGETSVAVPGDGWTFFHNPAHLALLEHHWISTSTVQPNGGDFNRLSALGAAADLPGTRGGLAFGFRHFGVEYKDVNLSQEQAISVAHGMTLFSDQSSSAHIGWAVNFYNVDFGTSIGGLNPGSAWTMGIDLGAVVTLRERTRAGFFTRNLNNPTIGEDQEELRQMVAAGIAYVPYDGVTTAFDLRTQLGEEFRFHGGVEFALTSVLDLRAGVETDPNKLTGGFSVHLPQYFSLDYGFSTGGGVLDSSHQFGLSIRIDEAGSATR